MFLFGLPNVQKMKERRDMGGLIKALSYQKDYSIRKCAAEALGEIGDNHAVEPLWRMVMVIQAAFKRQMHLQNYIRAAGLMKIARRRYFLKST